MTGGSILWRRLDRPGHEFARVCFQAPDWHLHGAAVFVHDQQPCRLDYEITCDGQWRTVSAKVAGWVGSQPIGIELAVDADGRWQLNQQDCPDVRGCLDLDLNFSPSTNLLPFRRLNLAVGQGAEVRAAWLRFPSFKLEPLAQVYRHLDDATYRYESAGGRFVTELEVNSIGLVTAYPKIWQAEALI